EPSETVYYLQKLSVEKANEIKQLLRFKDGTAGAMMTTEVMTAEVDETVGKVLERIFQTGKYSETIYYIYIVTGLNELLGVVSLRELMLVPRGHTMKFVMKKQVVTVLASTDEQEVVAIVKDY